MGKVARKRRRALRRRTIQAVEHYYILPDNWEHHYGLGPGDPRFDSTPYRHSEILIWTGRVILPNNFKYPKALITLSALEGMMSQRAGARTTIGAMTARNEELDAHVFVPAEHMGQLITLAASGRLKVISLSGETLKRHKGLISSISLKTELESELAEQIDQLISNSEKI